MHKRMIAIVCLAVPAVSLAGGSQCGWLWQDGRRACHAATTL
jgi:hypothetical protein